MPDRRLFLNIVLTMVAFAANSVLCRVALREGHIDPVTFSNIRLISGALVLLPLIHRHGWRFPSGKSLKNALFLMLYVVFFSVAYIHLDAGTGALLLFGVVQLAMITFGVLKGERISVLRGFGLLLAVAGMVILLLPGAKAPELASSLLMAVAGLAWAAYTLSGKNAANAGLATAWNFLLAVPFALLISPFLSHGMHLNSTGVLLAIVSGALASAGAYSLWYSLLPKMQSVTASTVQLSVPCLATLGGVLFLGESLSVRMVVSIVAVLVGILLTIRAQK